MEPGNALQTEGVQKGDGDENPLGPSTATGNPNGEELSYGSSASTSGKGKSESVGLLGALESDDEEEEKEDQEAANSGAGRTESLSESQCVRELRDQLRKAQATIKQLLEAKDAIPEPLDPKKAPSKEVPSVQVTYYALDPRERAAIEDKFGSVYSDGPKWKSYRCSSKTSNTQEMEQKAGHSDVLDRDFMPTDSLDLQIIKQVKHYFSKANLEKDGFLREKLSVGMGWVEVKLIATFFRMKKLTEDLYKIKGALRKSKSIQLSRDTTRCRPRPQQEMARNPSFQSVQMPESVVTYYQTFCVDRTGTRNMRIDISSASEVPEFRVPRHHPVNAIPLPVVASTRRGAAAPAMGSDGKVKINVTNIVASLSNCWNCGGEHMIRNCARLPDRAIVCANKELFHQFKGLGELGSNGAKRKRYYEDPELPVPFKTPQADKNRKNRKRTHTQFARKPYESPSSRFTSPSHRNHSAMGREGDTPNLQRSVSAPTPTETPKPPRQPPPPPPPPPPPMLNASRLPMHLYQPPPPPPSFPASSTPRGRSHGSYTTFENLPKRESPRQRERRRSSPHRTRRRRSRSPPRRRSRSPPRYSRSYK